MIFLPESIKLAILSIIPPFAASYAAIALLFPNLKDIKRITQELKNQNQSIIPIALYVAGNELIFDLFNFLILISEFFPIAIGLIASNYLISKEPSKTRFYLCIQIILLLAVFILAKPI